MNHVILKPSRLGNPPRRMREHFAPPNEDRRLQDEWANLKQQGTVFEYVSVLTALPMRISGLSQTQILDKVHSRIEAKDKEGLK
jgi:hypothetical protein